MWIVRLMVVFLIASVLMGCGGAVAPSNPQAQSPAQSNPQPPAAPANPETQPADTQHLPTQRYDNRQIIKEATFLCEVNDVPTAMNSIGTIARNLGGYVLETRSGATNNFVPSGFIKIGVPADMYETALQKIRDLAQIVLNEQSTGTDVSQEYVDTQSQIANLEATQQRVREFLNQAKSVEESLTVNTTLSGIEGQISQLKARISYLEQRSSFSTISVQLQLPPMTTPPPAPEPAKPETWTLKGVLNQAILTFKSIFKILVAILIWLIVVVVPYTAPWIIMWYLWKRYRHWRSMP